MERVKMYQMNNGMMRNAMTLIKRVLSPPSLCTKGVRGI